MNSPALHQFTNQQPFNLAQPPAHRRPTSSAGSVASPSLSQQGFNDPAEAIRVGKQRAKEVMAASNLEGGYATPQATNKDASQANGTVMSRKRSRSGSRIAHVQPPNDSVPIKDDRARNLLFQYMQRDALEEVAHLQKVHDVQDLADTKRAEVAQYRKSVYESKDRLRGRIHPDPAGPSGAWIPEIIYPGQRRLANRRTPELRIPRRLATEQAECGEDLIPLRLDVELEKLRLRDTFCWNLHDRTVPLKLFAAGLVEDLQVPDDHKDFILKQVETQCKVQIDNYYPPVWPLGEVGEPGLPYWAHKNDDMRITVKLNITVGYITLVDQFEWDINNPANSPEEFAAQMACDLSLSGEFTTAIAHSIREQSQLYYKSLYLTNYEFDGRPIEDADIRDNLMSSPVYSVFRPHQMQKDFSPFLFQMTENELEKIELSVLRELRAQKRGTTRRGGPTLPDLKERQRTARSLVVSSVIPGASETLEASGLIKIKRQSNRGKRKVTDDGSDEDEDELEDSGPDSPAPVGLGNTGTTARTRGMRGAASAAQAALRQSYGRSATPDAFLETPRRRVTELKMDEDADNPSLIVKLRINSTRFKSWLATKRFGKTGLPPLAGFPTSFKVEPALKNETPRPGNRALPKKARDETPGKESSATPRPKSRAADAAAKEYDYDEAGRILIQVIPPANEAPPPVPSWLPPALAPLKKKYPTSPFTPLMRLAVLNADTLEAVPYPATKLVPGSGPPDGPIVDREGDVVADRTVLAWAPRIKCNSCEKKIYTAFRTDTAERFEVHFRSRVHRENVEKRGRS